MTVLSFFPNLLNVTYTNSIYFFQKTVLRSVMKYRY